MPLFGLPSEGELSSFRVAISNNSILKLADGKVTFRYRASDTGKPLVLWHLSWTTSTGPTDPWSFGRRTKGSGLDAVLVVS